MKTEEQIAAEVAKVLDEVSRLSTRVSKELSGTISHHSAFYALNRAWNELNEAAMSLRRRETR